MFAEVIFVEGLYSRHIIVNLTYTPNSVSYKTLLGEMGEDTDTLILMYLGASIVKTAIILVLPKAFHSFNEISIYQ